MKSVAVVMVVTAVFWALAFSFFWDWEEVESGMIYKLGLLSSTPETLKGEMVAEWLRLSKDNPPLLNNYDLKEGKERLIKGGLIKEAALYKLPPSSLIVSYTLREPFAFVANWYNCVVDAEGHLFPFAPFFTPKELPEIVFPRDHALDFGPLEKVELPYFSLAKTIILQAGEGLERVDLSRLDRHHPRGGEVILAFLPRLFVRLWFDEWKERLEEVPKLLAKKGGKGTLDLRHSARAIFY